MTIALERLPAVLARYPKSKSALYVDIDSCLFVPPIAIGPRCVGWPSHEVDAILGARIAGRTDDQIKELVASLMERRKEAA